jgi:hypothetical protein
VFDDRHANAIAKNAEHDHMREPMQLGAAEHGMAEVECKSFRVRRYVIQLLGNCF